MTSYAFPGPQFPALPDVRVDAGAEWSPVQAPGAVLALRTTRDDGRFAPNIAALVSRHSPDFEPAVELDAIATEISGREDGTSDAPFDVEIGGRRFAGRVTAFRDSQAGTLAQLHLLTTVRHDDAVDSVHLVGTCAGDRVESDLVLIRDVLSTVRVGTG